MKKYAVEITLIFIVFIVAFGVVLKAILGASIWLGLGYITVLLVGVYLLVKFLIT